jgi:hypothetical protein
MWPVRTLTEGSEVKFLTTNAITTEERERDSKANSSQIASAGNKNPGLGIAFQHIPEWKPHPGMSQQLMYNTNNNLGLYLSIS